MVLSAQKIAEEASLQTTKMALDAQREQGASFVKLLYETNNRIQNPNLGQYLNLMM
jgi:hypothetical protein